MRGFPCNGNDHRGSAGAPVVSHRLQLGGFDDDLAMSMTPTDVGQGLRDVVEAEPAVDVDPDGARDAALCERLEVVRPLLHHQQPDAAAGEPAELGEVREELTQALRERLAAQGATTLPTVYESGDGQSRVAVFAIDGQEIRIRMPTRPGPPRELWWLLGTWLALIVIGTVAISLVMARRVTEPFSVLESAIASVGADGVLPRLPEKGSGEMRQTAAALNRLSDRLKSAMESRMRLVAAAGHDLRTPMTRMRLRAEFLSETDRESWLRDFDELELIADSAIRLVREEASGEDAQVLDLEALLIETSAELREQGQEVTLAATEQLRVRAGRLALKRALRNVLVNAATHGRGGIADLFRNGSEAQVVVRDRGPGIPEDLIDKVFEPFFRAEPGRIQRVPGAGLGLAIAKEIVERYGGTITIANGPGGGLEQRVRLPLAEQSR
jgi:signal transduction histidine kinase